MKISYLKKSFIEYCRSKKYEINQNQIAVIESLNKFFLNKKSFLNYFFKTESKLCFYLQGDVGVGKTMILDFFYNILTLKKKRLHFNEFMINFHDFRHSNKENSIPKFVKELKKKYEFIYLDEFQVTNIVDAMILGKLFEQIFKEEIRILITSNTKVQNLYKNGLQREQFLPFILTIKKYSTEKELLVFNDYRKSDVNNKKRYLTPLNEKNNFIISQLFHKITKNKKKTIKFINIKGRKYEIKNFYENVARFNFNELCGINIGAEDYIGISSICDFIIIEKVPNFSDENLDKQQRFITLIDILYEKNVSIAITSEFSLNLLNSSLKLEKPFKRCVSRIYELTSKPWL